MKIINICLLLLVMNSCNKDLLEYNSLYEGEWRTIPIALSNGKIVHTYFSVKGKEGIFRDFCNGNDIDCGNFYSGRVVINYNKRKIRIGKMFEGSGIVEIKITTPPFLNSSNCYECVFNGTTYYKQ
jgi:hypothetical protein